MKITYAITVCNETDEIKRLLDFLFENKRNEDDIVVLFDEKHGNNDVKLYLDNITNKSFKYHTGTFEHHFGCWKNRLKSYCAGDYIFFIDADEIPNLSLIHKLPNIISSNYDLFYVPRIDMVKGLTEEHNKKWGWKINEKGWINFPDYQMRIIKNSPSIFWTNPVHEVLTGYSNPTQLPPEETYSLYHFKEIKRQEKQNIFYDTIKSENFNNKLNIIYRTCDAVSVTSGWNQKRDFGTKQEIIFKCFDSLVKALKAYKGKYNLYVVNDHLSDKTREYMESFGVITKMFNLIKTGNGPSFDKCVEVGLSCFGSILFLEDDYLIEENCFNEMMFFKDKMINTPKFAHKHICLYPLDEDGYSKPEQSYIMTGLNRHWKTINHTTCTFMIDDYILKDQLVNLQRYRNYGTPGITEDNTVNLMYKKYPCFSPLPTLVEHMQYYNCLSPFSRLKK